MLLVTSSQSTPSVHQTASERDARKAFSEFAATGLQTRRFPPRSFDGACDLSKVRLHRLSKIGKLNRASSMEEGTTKLGFECPDRICERRLRNTTTPSGARKLLFLTEREEVANLMHLHVCPPKTAPRSLREASQH
jgi:hypothetical protein